jgi:hypothetical protein
MLGCAPFPQLLGNNKSRNNDHRGTATPFGAFVARSATMIHRRESWYIYVVFPVSIVSAKMPSIRRLFDRPYVGLS